MLTKGNMLRLCVVCVLTSDYPSKRRNYDFLETTENEYITQTMVENKVV